MGRAGRTSEPCKHSIIIVVRENTDLFSARRLGAARPPCRTQNNDGSRFDAAATASSSPSLPPPSPPPSSPRSSFSRSLPLYASKIFLRYVTDRPSAVSRVSRDKGAGRWKGTFLLLLLNCLYATSFRAICSRRILLKAEVRRVQRALRVLCSNGARRYGEWKKNCEKLSYFIRWSIILYCSFVLSLILWVFGLEMKIIFARFRTS